MRREASYEPRAYEQAVEALAALGRHLDARSWVLGTSGNLSVVVSRDPLLVAITRSGAFKGRLGPRDIVLVAGDGTPVSGEERPSAEAAVHLELVRAGGAGAVLHTHSVWSTIVSDHPAARAAGGVTIEGYEMLKGLAGIATHEHREWLPLLENDQDLARLAWRVRIELEQRPGIHGFLLRRHGLYTWGRDLDEAARHIEILEFLLETIGRSERLPWRS